MISMISLVQKLDERNEGERDALSGFEFSLKNLPCKLVTTLFRSGGDSTVYIFFALENLESCELELIIWHSQTTLFWLPCMQCLKKSDEKNLSLYILLYCSPCRI